jgi:hypothetical protein
LLLTEEATLEVTAYPDGVEAQTAVTGVFLGGSGPCLSHPFARLFNELTIGIGMVAHHPQIPDIARNFPPALVQRGR